MEQQPTGELSCRDHLRQAGVVLIFGVFVLALVFAMLPQASGGPDTASRAACWVVVAVGAALWALWLRKVVRTRMAAGEGQAAIWFSYWMFVCGMMAGPGGHSIAHIWPRLGLIGDMAGALGVMLMFATQFPRASLRRVQIIACHVALACSLALGVPLTRATESQARQYVSEHSSLTLGLLVVWATCAALVLCCTAPGFWRMRQWPPSVPPSP